VLLFYTASHEKWGSSLGMRSVNHIPTSTCWTVSGEVRVVANKEVANGKWCRLYTP